MSAPASRTVDVAGHACRVWDKGSGSTVGYLAGFGGLPAWTPFLDRLSERHRVIVPSLPGQPGAPAFRNLDSHLDWLVATQELLAAAGLAGADLIGVSVGGALAADVAAVWPDMVRRLVLVAPFGMFDPADPVTDVWAQRPGTAPGVLCDDPAIYTQLWERPEGEDPTEWEIITTRAMEAAARLLWPVGDTRLARRLHRVRQDTLLLWGENDRVVPLSYARRFADAIAGTATIETIAGAGHLADLDQPDAVADRVTAFLA